MMSAGTDTLLLRFLYRTAPGRLLLKPVASPGVSRLAGRLLSTRLSRRLIPGFIRKHGIDMTDVIEPEGGFSSFNEFFSRRRLQRQERPREGDLICPCDGLLSAFRIGEDTRLKVKGTPYSMGALLEDDRLAESFRGGVALIFRLTPQHYHRYCYSTDGTVLEQRRIDGVLHCVRPVALETVPVFIRNTREYQVIRARSGHEIAQMEVGALLVGKISNHPVRRGEEVLAGQEKGCFAFGGSTVILLLPEGAASGGRYEGLIGKEEELPVVMGDPLQS